ncbi:hypothetical protein RchiOBHm_Chr7g0192251 [Rosa chinensis]|uniref:Uncharacterized protein n=1 Tax=Rosa chinensis TaxID=74649 RepID=A0A2P6P5J9_ROSCH|nr:hypothetical protein RchiOBHm_Chr7g0192251 [Rosa chinensis]
MIGRPGGEGGKHFWVGGVVGISYPMRKIVKKTKGKANVNRFDAATAGGCSMVKERVLFLLHCWLAAPAVEMSLHLL